MFLQIFQGIERCDSGFMIEGEYLLSIMNSFLRKSVDQIVDFKHLLTINSITQAVGSITSASK
jgi:hypothetical protein